MVDSYKVDSSTKNIVWDSEGLSEGTYFVLYKSASNKTIAVEKLIVTKN